MTLETISGQEIRAAQAFTGATFALWIAVGYLPAVRRHATSIRAVLLVVYLAGFVGFVGYALLD
jgi:hypothetical protein